MPNTTTPTRSPIPPSHFFCTHTWVPKNRFRLRVGEGEIKLMGRRPSGTPQAVGKWTEAANLLWRHDLARNLSIRASTTRLAAPDARASRSDAVMSVTYCTARMTSPADGVVVVVEGVVPLDVSVTVVRVRWCLDSATSRAVPMRTSLSIPSSAARRVSSPCRSPLCTSRWSVRLRFFLLRPTRSRTADMSRRTSESGCRYSDAISLLSRRDVSVGMSAPMGTDVSRIAAASLCVGGTVAGSTWPTFSPMARKNSRVGC